MEKVEKSVSSVMFSCTKNVILAVAGVYLLCLLYGVLDSNSDSIFAFFDSIFSHIGNFLAPAKVFLIEHLGTFFIGWIISVLWVVCVSIKLESNSINLPIVFNIFSALLVPIGCILFFMASCKLDSIFSFFSAVISFFLLLFSIGLLAVIFFDDESEAVDTESKPVQLELFDKK